MDAINVSGIIAVFSTFGPVGLIALVWYCDMKAIRKILASYKEDMAETRRMYENNIKLVENYEGLAGDLKDIIILNTQQMTHLWDEIKRDG